MELNHFSGTKQERSEARTALRCKATVLFQSAPPVTGKTIDISPHGMGIHVPDHVAPGTLCGIKFTTLVNGKVVTIEVVAKVVYSICANAGFRVGFQFTNVDHAAKQAITQITG